MCCRHRCRRDCDDIFGIRDRDCDRDDVRGIRRRDCFTFRDGDFCCICVRNPRSWR
jgi:hypothetical protein